MIVFDTNVISELMSVNAEPRVLRWIATQRPAESFTTAITEAEVLTGIEVMPRGKRRTALDARARHVFASFADRVLPFDRAAAAAFATIKAERERAGRPIEDLDAQIAAIAKSVGASVATRNVKDFDDCGFVVVNPWAA